MQCHFPLVCSFKIIKTKGEQMYRYWGSAIFFIVSICSAIESEIFYELYHPNNANADQTAGAPGSHSNLVGYTGHITDTAFAEKVAKPALSAGAKIYMVLNQCFGGGFTDELAKLGGTQSILTAARHNETASYGYPAPDGVDIDSTDAFNIALGNGKIPAKTVATEAVALNPFGPNPNAKRVNETEGSEHAQYFFTGGGDQLKPADYTDKGIAVLWAGQPAERDGIQMNLMIDRLIEMGFSPDKIWLLYGGGKVDAAHPIARSHISGKSHPIHLQAATEKNLFALFTKNFKKRDASTPDFVFLYVGDHGGVDEKSMAKTGYTPDLLVTPNLQITPGMNIVGEGP